LVRHLNVKRGRRRKALLTLCLQHEFSDLIFAHLIKPEVQEHANDGGPITDLPWLLFSLDDTQTNFVQDYNFTHLLLASRNQLCMPGAGELNNT